MVLALCLNDIRGQDQAPVPAPAQPTAPAPNQPFPPGPGPRPMPRPMPARPGQPRMYVQRALAELRRVKTSLQGSQEDYGGHKDSAIAACDKALEELDAVMKAMPVPTPPQRPGMPPGAQQNLTPLPPGAKAPPTAPNATVPPNPQP